MNPDRYVAPMPPQLRNQLRASYHPARSVPCPHCEAKAHAPCTLRGGRRLPDPHFARCDAWARQTACCPECQVEPGMPCHDDGHELRGGTVHTRRHQEAEETNR